MENRKGSPQHHSITKRIRQCEGALDYSDLDGVSCQHLDDIEAEGNIRHLQQSNPVKRPLADKLLLLPIDRIQGTTEFLGSASLHLREDQSVIIPADEINLSPTGSTKVSPEHLPSKMFQMVCRLILTPVPKGNVRSGTRTQRWAGRPAQNHVDDTGKVHVSLA